MKLPQPDLPALAAALRAKVCGPYKGELRERKGELALRLPVEGLPEALLLLRNDDDFAFEQLIDLCGLDFSSFGMGYEGLFTQDAINERGQGLHGEQTPAEKRFAVVYQLLSLKHNHRVRVRVMLRSAEFPACPSATEIWPAANWYEREAFDLFGIAFEGHPDLRRLLTDYGFIGHPFRRDFPVYGKVEMRYDPEQGRVIYQPVTITPREVVPRIRRKDNFGERQPDG